MQDTLLLPPAPALSLLSLDSFKAQMKKKKADFFLERKK